ncbi:hypothetical protein BBJ28_00024564 [Nothophytophthora sp. Chile5]|nr:hypothetical protein BBJ28_00024564 [Nothophytophthora sp. Chile5]
MPYAIVGIKYELAWRDHDERVLYAQQARRNRPLGEIAADVAAETKRRPPAVRIGAPGALDLLDSDGTLEPLETQAVKCVSSGACDHFYELSQQLVGVDLSLQQLTAIDTGAPSTPVTMESVLQLTKRRSDGTSRMLDAIMIVLKLHKQVCADVYALLPSLSRESPTKSAAANADRRKSIRILSAMGLSSKVGNTRNSSTSSPHASATMSGAKSALARLGSRAMSGSAKKERARHADPNSRRGVVWSMFEHRNDVRLARIGNKVRFYAVLLSIVLFYLQTTPELQKTGLRSVLCQRSTRDFCHSHDEPGCYVFHENAASGSGGNTSVSVTSEHVRFDCAVGASDETCYASGVNFGSENFPLPCNETFGAIGISHVCNNRLCQSSLTMIFDMEPHWVYFEFLFGILFTAELALCVYAHPARRQLWGDVGALVDVLVLIPFYVEVGEIIAGGTPTYSIVPTTPSFFTAIRILKTLRILKLGVHIPGARVLTKTTQLIWRRLMIPVSLAAAFHV